MGSGTREPPAGDVTFVFTDVEGSTRLLQELGSQEYADELLAHRRQVREIVEAHHGFELGTEGDAFFIAFDAAFEAIAAAVAMQHALHRSRVRIRVGIHTGQPLFLDGDYFGLDVHKAARICSAAHGGQVLVSSATRQHVAGELRDLGEHRLKDLSAPERLFQLGDGDFPPLRTLRQAGLPVQPTPLVGRERELEELLALVRSHRLVTLTGPGGVGKTRLALEVVAELGDHVPDGVWWVPLAAVADREVVIPKIAAAVGARGSLHEHLADKALVLLLDNLEQVLGAAADLADLLAHAPSLRIVATSRERLAIAGEYEYAVPPLSEAAATDLFVTRARQVQSDFEPDENVRTICRRLDCLPLALELASTRVKMMNPGQILARLDRSLALLVGGRRDAAPRQATMRAAIDWSYELLPYDQKRVFRNLSVFAGSFELDAAECVCRTSVDDLQSLVDKSLLRQNEHARFFMLETTREYAADRLADSGESPDLQRRHAEWFLALAASAHAELETDAQGAWFERLRADADNLRAALAWALDHDVVSGLALADTLFRPWHMSGQVPELVRWYEGALQRDGIDAAVRAKALATYGDALGYLEELERAKDALIESIALFDEIGDAPSAADTRGRLSGVLWLAGDHGAAIALQRIVLAAAERRGDRAAMSRALHLLGEYSRDAGDLAEGRAFLERAAAMDSERGNRLAAMASLHSLGDLELDAGDPTRAAQFYREALLITTELRDDRSTAYCLAGLASAAGIAGRLSEAGRLWAIVEAAEASIGIRFLGHERDRYERILRPRAGDAAFRAGAGVAAEQTLEEAALLALEGG